MKKTINHIIFSSLIFSQCDVNAAVDENLLTLCPSLKNVKIDRDFDISKSTNDTIIKEPISVVGNENATWILFPKKAAWGKPVIKKDDGKNVYLKWDIDGECMKLFDGFQRFNLIKQYDSVTVTRKS